jgi:uncharacterized membrane protein
MIAMLALYSLGGLIIAGISVPLILYKIPPNSFFGFRNQSTRDNPRLWYKINAYAGMRSNILYYLSASLEEYALSCLGVFLALFLWTMITSFLYMRANR